MSYQRCLLQFTAAVVSSGIGLRSSHSYSCVPNCGSMRERERGERERERERERKGGRKGEREKEKEKEKRERDIFTTFQGTEKCKN